MVNRNSLDKQYCTIIRKSYLEKIHGLLETLVYHGNHKNVVSFLFGLFFCLSFLDSLSFHCPQGSGIASDG